MQRFLSLTLLLVAAIRQIISMSPLSVPSFSPLEAEAQQQGDILIERGHTHAIYDLGNGNYTTAFGLPPWVLDESTGEYVPHIVNDLGNDTVEVRSGRIGWIIGPIEAQIYDPDLKEHRATERWLPRVDSTVLDKFFQRQTVNTNSTGVYVTNTYSAQVGQRTITLELIYAIHDGEPAQRIVTVTGLPRNFASTLVLEREWVAMNAAEIRDETGSETLTADSRTLSGLDGTIRGIRFTDANGELLVHENLVTAGDKLKSIDYSSNRAVFKYSGWTDGNIVLVDDTRTDSDPARDGFVFTDNTSGTACSTTASDINDSLSALLLLVSDSSSSSTCRRAFVEWDITIIPNDATISNVVFKFEVDNDSGARNCTYTPIATQPNSAPTAQTLWDDIGDGTPYVSDDSTCTTVGTNKSVDLGSSADSAVQSALTSDWWAIGIKIHNEVRDGSSHNVSLVSEDGLGTPDPTLEVTYSVPVTQPITITVDNSGTQSTFTLSGCSVSPTTIATDGAAHNFTADPSCTITITVSSDQANTRYRFSGGSTTTTVNTCASGTCSGSSKTVYFELQNTYQTSTNGNGPPTWDSGLSAAVTGTVAGAGSTTICTINPSSGTTTTAPCSGWSDYNRSASLPSTLSGAGANIRWLGSGTLAWTDTTGGNTHTGAYYKQLQNTYQASPAGQRTTFNAAMTINIIGFHLGSSGQIITGIATSSGGGTASSNAWTDYNREAKLDQTEVLSATERWMSLTQPSWTQTTGGNTNTGNYYNQFQPNITASGISASVTTVTVTRTQFNISGNTDIAGSTATGIWADYSTVISIENPVPISSTERWFAGDDATVSWTQTDATNRVSDSYTRQWEKDVTLSGLQTVNATRTFLGTAGPEPVSTGEDYYLDLDGSDDYVRLAQNATFSGEWHYTTWFNRDDSGGFHTFIGKDYGVTAGVKIGLCGAGACGAGNDNKLFVRLVDGGSTSIIDIGYTTSDNDRWNFMSVGRDGSNNVKASLNGDSYVTGSTLSGSFTINSIGRSFAGGQFFKGSLGDQKLYDAFLSQTDTDRLANGAAVTQNLVNHWKFNEGTGTTTVDAVGTNDGTLTSGPTWTLGLWIDHNTSLTFPDPVSISSTERWDTDSTVSYTPTDATGITLSYTKQWGPNITASGISASVTTVTVTRTQEGSTGTTAASGSTTTEIWADYGTTFTIPTTVTIVTEENRFQSYDSASELSYNVTSTNTKTITYQHEFNMLFRVHEEHLGVIFIPMPPALFTGTITTSNSTALNLTFDTQVTDDHLQPSEGRYWVKNGTTTWTDITWRDLVVNATGSQSITAYGNFDIESASKHHGYEGNRHFRVAVDGGTIDEDSSTFDADASTFEFEATATGTKTAKVEFLTTIYGGVADVHVNGTSFDSANWNVQDLGDDLTGVVTINNLSFSTNIIKVFFTGYGSGSSPSGGGGGASAGSFVPIPSFENPFDGLLPSADVKVTVPTYNVPPGGSQTQNILIEWDASTVAIIQQIEFAAHPEWFQVGATLPMKVTLMPGEDKLRAQIPLTVFLPDDVQGVEQIVDMRVTTAIGATSVTEVKPVRVVLASTSMLAYLGLGTLIVAGTVGVALQARKRGGGRRIRVRRR